ncbi:PTS sugar transporter subunit IIA [Salsipaludibacter albus]|uniref:PTS sugar transporter subunit IIA n=1 Tax=Salsipaludibacter albus TaxID=2849650 RepID=UPI001EE3E017|nr:PTS sugar transporter subunit IIA [Salsipaludibacter albus]MBY5163457.1 PTS sugar transporter subunit IIA [Salsipaludibacter albus]
MDVDLASVLHDDAIDVRYEAGDWEDAVRRAGTLLVEVGAAEERYVQAIVDGIHEHGPYVVLAPGIAIPHARPESGGLDVGISVVTLAHPVEFGAKDNDPVDLVFGLVTNDSEAHLQALGALAEHISEPENVQALRDADSPEAVARLMKDGP